MMRGRLEVSVETCRAEGRQQSLGKRYNRSLSGFRAETMDPIVTSPLTCGTFSSEHLDVQVATGIHTRLAEPKADFSQPCLKWQSHVVVSVPLSVSRLKRAPVDMSEQHSADMLTAPSGLINVHQTNKKLHFMSAVIIQRPEQRHVTCRQHVELSIFHSDYAPDSFRAVIIAVSVALSKHDYRNHNHIVCWFNESPPERTNNISFVKNSNICVGSGAAFAATCRRPSLMTHRLDARLSGTGQGDDGGSRLQDLLNANVPGPVSCARCRNNKPTSV
ncbi:uncharacterized protein V6R79_016388 [Siganus canaliculatus]